MSVEPWVVHRMPSCSTPCLNGRRRHILAGLEVLIVADLIRTILHLSLANILLLGAIVVIRSFISFMMEYEMKALKND